MNTQTRNAPRRWTALALAILACAAPTVSAVADPAPPDEPLRPTLREPVDEGRVPALALDLTGALGLDEQGVAISVGLLVSGAFEDLFVPPRAGVRAALAKSASNEGEVAEPAQGDPEAIAVPSRAALAPQAAPSGALARRTVRAALAAARSRERAAELDDLATRARASGAIPELRVRVARVVDEGQSLSPTEYDPARVTATGGTSLWLEGRATFQLDRLVFAPEELAVERLRLEREKLDREIVREVLDALGALARARAAAFDETLDDAAREAAALDAAVLEARLDVLTDGWFGARVDRVPLGSGPPQPE